MAEKTTNLNKHVNHDVKPKNKLHDSAVLKKSTVSQSIL